MNERHEKFIRLALLLAKSARGKGNHPFGALLVIGDAAVARAENTVALERDHTRHAEMNLVSAALRCFDPQVLSGATLYTSTEPCAMCAGAIYWAGIRRVVYGCASETLAAMAGGSLLIPCREIFGRGDVPTEVVGPVLEEESAQAHAGFWSPRSLETGRGEVQTLSASKPSITDSTVILASP